MVEKTMTPKKDGATATRFLIQLLVYSIFVFAYYLLVLHFLGGRLKWLFDSHRAVYAAVALTLMIAQGVLLELLTGWLFRVIHRKSK